MILVVFHNLNDSAVLFWHKRSESAEWLVLKQWKASTKSLPNLPLDKQNQDQIFSWDTNIPHSTWSSSLNAFQFSSHIKLTIAVLGTASLMPSTPRSSQYMIYFGSATATALLTELTWQPKINYLLLSELLFIKNRFISRIHLHEGAEPH